MVEILYKVYEKKQTKKVKGITSTSDAVGISGTNHGSENEPEDELEGPENNNNGETSKDKDPSTGCQAITTPAVI